MGSSQQHEVVKGLSAEQLKTVLDTLDRSFSEKPQQRRRSGRIRYRSHRVSVHVLDKHDNVQACLRVPTRNVSAHGLAFLHRQMLALGQVLRIDIPLLDDQIMQVRARTVRCQHIRGMVHEIGVEFMGAVTCRPSYISGCR